MQRKDEVMNASTKTSTIDPLLHPKEAAKILNVSLSWLAKARLSGTGPRFVKISCSVRRLHSSLQDFIRARMRGSTSEC
jgi:hypothetical protein